MLRITVLMFLVLVLGIAKTRADSTDAQSAIQILLQNYGPVSVTRYIGVPHTQRVCSHPSHGTPAQKRRLSCSVRNVMVQQPSTTSEILTATNLRIVQSDPVVLDPKIQTSEPDKLSVNGATYLNCSSQAVTFQTSLQVGFTRSASLGISKTITHTRQAQLNFGWKLSEVLQLGGQVTVGEQEAIATVDTTGWQQTITRGYQAQAQLAPKTAMYVEVETWPVTYAATFHTNVVVDADLSDNDKGFKKLSDIIDASKRRFPIAGTFGFVDAAEAQNASFDIPFDASKCDSGKTIVTIPVAPASRPQELTSKQ